MKRNIKQKRKIEVKCINKIHEKEKRNEREITEITEKKDVDVKKIIKMQCKEER